MHLPLNLHLFLLIQTDSVCAANKIVYAVIKVSFKDFAQAEIFRIVAIPIATTNNSAKI